MKKYILILASFFSFQSAYSLDSTTAGTPPDQGQESDLVDNTQALEAHFLDKLSAHHSEAIHMSKIALSKSNSATIRLMSDKMIKEQNSEINLMSQWRKTDYSVISKAKDLPQKMDDSVLKMAKGNEFNRKFLSMMIKHHQAGIMMIQENEPHFKSAKVRSFAQNTSMKQSIQIQKMQGLLDRMK